MLIRQMPSAGDAMLLDQTLPLEGFFKPAPQKVKWVTAEIAERFGREYYLVTTAREMVFYLMFLFCATMAVLAKLDKNAYYMTAAIKEQVAEERFVMEGQYITFRNVKKLEDLHQYLVDSLAMQLYWTSFDTVTRVQLIPNKDRGVLYSNKLIGIPTMRQIPMKNNTCEIHPRFERHYNMTCKDGYRNRKRLVKDPLPGCSVPDGACEYKAAKDTLAVSYYGKLGYYPADGYQAKLGQDREKFVAVCESLKKGGWYLQTTRVIFLDFTLYNPNLDLFCAVKLVFELPPVGGIVPTANFHTFQPLYSKGTKFKRFADGCLIICGLFALYYLAEEIREMVFMRVQYLKLFWSYIDFATALLVLLHVIIALVVKNKTVSLVEPMAKDSSNIAHVSLQNIAALDNVAANMQGCALFLIYMKVFKYLSLNIVTGQLNNTLKRSGKYLMFFSLIFTLVMMAFAEFGYIVYGTEIEEYSVLSKAIFTLMRTVLGDFNYGLLELSHPIIAPIFFVLFIFMVFFVLVNMFLAIICGNYTYVKTDMAVGPEVMQMTEFWKRGAHNLCKAMNCDFCARVMAKRSEYNVAAEQIRYILNRCGFSNLDVDIFMARYNVEPADLVKVRDISKLLEFLRIPAAENMTPKKGPAPKLEVKPTGPPIMALEDFNAQQEKLNQIEVSMTSIADRLDLLLRKMNALSEVRK